MVIEFRGCFVRIDENRRCISSSVWFSRSERPQRRRHSQKEACQQEQHQQSPGGCDTTESNIHADGPQQCLIHFKALLGTKGHLRAICWRWCEVTAMQQWIHAWCHGCVIIGPDALFDARQSSKIPWSASTYSAKPALPTSQIS